MFSIVLATIYGLSWVVELDHGTESQGYLKSKVLQSQSKISSQILKLGARNLQSISYIANLIKFEMPESQFEKVNAIQGIKRIRKAVTVSAPSPVLLSESEKSHSNDPHDVTNVKAAWEQYGVTGEGILVGILDTGIDYTHSAFRNSKNVSCVGPHCRIVKCFDFTGELARTDCLDTGSHGTHVAGIIGGFDDTIKGVAPKVQFGSYKVFKHGVKNEDYFQVYQALDQAAKDGMHIINMSLGIPSGWDGGIIESIYARLDKLGIIIINSNGNSGRDGLYMVGSPGVSQYALGIAAFNTNLANASFAPTVFTSWGPSPFLKIKPEIGAPGQGILSSIPNSMCADNKPCYGVKSGTSMSAPYIAGTAALYIQHNKNSRNFKSKAMATASPATTENGIAYSTLQQGSGMVNVQQLLTTTTILEPSKLDLGAVSKGSFKLIKIINEGSAVLNMTLDHTSAVAVHGSGHSVVSKQFKNTAKMTERKISIKPKSSRRVGIWIQPDYNMNTEENWLFSGYILFKNDQNPENVFRVPYAGFYGNYQNLPTFPSDNSFPLLETAGKLFRNRSDVIAVTGNEELPLLKIKFMHHVEALQVQIMNKTDGLALGLTHYEQHIRKYDGEYEDAPAQSKTFEFKSYFENGQYCVGCYATDVDMKNWVPMVDGEYWYKVTAQKPLGKTNKKEDYVVWESPTIVLSRQGNVE